MPRSPAADGLMTQAAFARYRGVSRQTVQRWKDRGEIVMTVNASGRPRVDVAQSDAALAALQNPLKSQSSPSPAPEHAGPQIAPAGADKSETPTPAERTRTVSLAARAQKETADAALSRLKYEKMAGNLVPRVEVEGVGPACAALLQQALESRRTQIVRAVRASKSEREGIALLKNSDFNDVLTPFAAALLDFDQIAAPNQEAVA